ncbi:hypothetical protein BG844_36090 [Couchioplanes caeruleus subsp. caeruleus]|uniref:Uncharacterized protein n=1 Tax=Couchioplanes caeruleus subsp. caeruleus TaxID=56427 RepID=A0A1K0GFR8_9ACTN|nr:hypothetical protein BG844_36090 [Couchioplanes caeruleus subsp. caeruleus]
MLMRISRAAAVGCALLATVGWALALTLFQPLTEVIGEHASPNQYWARDLRWTALLAVCGGLVAALRPTARSAAVIGGTGVALLIADVILDRADVAGPLAAAVFVPAALALVTMLWRVLRTRLTRPGRSAALACAALTAAATPLTPFVAVVAEGDPHPTLVPAALATGALLAVVAVASAAAAAGEAPRPTPFAVLCVVAAACVAAPGDFIVVSVLGALLLTASTVVALRIGPGRAAALLAGLVLAYPAAVVALRMLTYQLGALFTGAAGGPPQMPEDDVVFIPAIALGIGVAYAAALLMTRVAHRPRPAATRHAGAVHGHRRAVAAGGRSRPGAGRRHRRGAGRAGPGHRQAHRPGRQHDRARRHRQHRGSGSR